MRGSVLLSWATGCQGWGGLQSCLHGPAPALEHRDRGLSCLPAWGAPHRRGAAPLPLLEHSASQHQHGAARGLLQWGGCRASRLTHQAGLRGRGTPAVPALPRALPARATSAGHWAQHPPPRSTGAAGSGSGLATHGRGKHVCTLGCGVTLLPSETSPGAGTSSRGGHGCPGCTDRGCRPRPTLWRSRGVPAPAARAQGQGAPPRGDSALPVAARGGTGTAQLTPGRHGLTLLKQPSVPPHHTCAARTGEGPGAHRALALTTKQKPITIIFMVRGPWCPRSPRRSTSCCAITSPAPMRAPATSTARSGGCSMPGPGETLERPADSRLLLPERCLRLPAAPLPLGRPEPALAPLGPSRRMAPSLLGAKPARPVAQALPQRPSASGRSQDDAASPAETVPGCAISPHS